MRERKIKRGYEREREARRERVKERETRIERDKKSGEGNTERERG